MTSTGPQKGHHRAVKRQAYRGIEAVKRSKSKGIIQKASIQRYRGSKREEERSEHQKLGFQFIIKPNKQAKYTKVPGSKDSFTFSSPSEALLDASGSSSSFSKIEGSIISFLPFHNPQTTRQITSILKSEAIHKS